MNNYNVELFDKFSTSWWWPI